MTQLHRIRGELQNELRNLKVSNINDLDKNKNLNSIQRCNGESRVGTNSVVGLSPNEKKVIRKIGFDDKTTYV